MDTSVETFFIKNEEQKCWNLHWVGWWSNFWSWISEFLFALCFSSIFFLDNSRILSQSQHHTHTHKQTHQKHFNYFLITVRVTCSRCNTNLIRPWSRYRLQRGSWSSGQHPPCRWPVASHSDVPCNPLGSGKWIWRVTEPHMFPGDKAV